MQIAQVLGGYTLGRADLLRRAMGKKKAEEMQRERVGFVEGASKNGVDPKLAGEIFDLMEKFAAYGFNKSHSAAYALITMQTAWLKCHYPAEFMAALLTSDSDKTDKLVAHIADARARGLEVLPPDINESARSFHGASSRIRFGLGGIKGVGDGAIEAMLDARNEEGKGPFLGLYDFCERVDLRRVNRKVIECLIRSGAFDFTGVPRWKLFATIDSALERGQATQRDRISGQASLFGMLGGGDEKAAAKGPGEDGPYLDAEPWTDREKLAGERETIGFYITGHPLDPYEDEMKRYATHTISRILEGVPSGGIRGGEQVRIVGVAAGLRTRATKSGRLMGFVTLEDLTGTLEMICFSGGARRGPPRPDRPVREGGLEIWQPLLESDQPLLVSGTVQINTRNEDNPVPELIADEIVPLSEVRAQRASRVSLRLEAEHVSEERLQRVLALLRQHPGDLPVEVQVTLPGKTLTRLAVPDLRVTPADELRERLNMLFGAPVVSVDL